MKAQEGVYKEGEQKEQKNRGKWQTEEKKKGLEERGNEGKSWRRCWQKI